MIIYEITNTVNGKVYVGQTTYPNPRRRWSLHRCHLRNGKHKSVHLQNAWNKYGEDSFSFTSVCSARHGIELDELEVAQIAFRQSTDRDFGYNTFLGGQGSLLGHSAETRAKIAASNTGKKLSPETKAKLRAHTLANPVSAEGRKRHADALRGKPRNIPPEVFSAMVRKGWEKRSRGNTAETRRRISEGLRRFYEDNPAQGIGVPLSAETRARLSEAHRQRERTNPRPRCPVKGTFLPFGQIAA